MGKILAFSSLSIQVFFVHKIRLFFLSQKITLVFPPLSSQHFRLPPKKIICFFFQTTLHLVRASKVKTNRNMSKLILPPLPAAPPSLTIFSEALLGDTVVVVVVVVEGGSLHSGTVPFHFSPSQPKTGCPSMTSADFEHANLMMAPPYSTRWVTLAGREVERSEQPGRTQLGTVLLHTPSWKLKHLRYST